MRKLKSLVAVVALVGMPLMALPVSATDCTITNTGPDSNNTCEVNTNYRCTVQNDTVIIVDNDGQQVATSGSANGSGNTGSGDATSGSATNSNGTTFEFEVDNEGCVVTAVTEPKPEAPVGGSGAAGEATPVVAKPTVLAKTSGESTLPVLAGAAALLVAALAAVRGYAALRSRS